MQTDEQIALSDRPMRAVVVTPEGTAPSGGWPGVVVVYEVFGLAPEMVAAAQRFADAGYVAVLPDILSGAPKPICLARAMGELRAGRPGRFTAACDAAREWLAARPDVDGTRLGVIGFCLGGSFALLLAAAAPPGLRAASVNYAEVPEDPAALARVCPVVASYGGRDRLAPKAAVLEERLTALAVPHDVRLYPEAGHSFMTEGHHPVLKAFEFVLHAGYVESAASDAWRRVFAFFDTHVRGESTVDNG